MADDEELGDDPAMVEPPGTSPGSSVSQRTVAASKSSVMKSQNSVDTQDTVKSEVLLKETEAEDLQVKDKRPSVDQLLQDGKGQKVRANRLQRPFRDMLGTRVLRTEELEKQKGDLRQRLDVLECSVPAVMVWNIWRMAQGAPVSSLQRVMEKQFQGPASGEVYCPSTPSRHFDCRVREVEAERKQAQKRAEEARVLWAEKLTALEERKKQLQEAKRVQQERQERINELTKQAQELKQTLKTVETDDSCQTGECGDIQCRQRWLAKVSSGSSIRSSDVECLERLQELAEEELNMKRQITDLERREEAYMRTLQQADELWSRMEGDTASTLSALQEQLDLKTAANQQMADRIVQLEDDVEKLRARLATCRNELEKFMSVDTIEALIGGDDDMAEVSDKAADVYVKMRHMLSGRESDLAGVDEKDILAKQEMTDEGTLVLMKREVADSEAMAMADYTDSAMEAIAGMDDKMIFAKPELADSQLGIRPEDFDYEDERLKEAREYLALLGSLDELDEDDDYVCPADFACNDLVFTETGMDDDELAALEGKGISAIAVQISQHERQIIVKREVVDTFEPNAEEIDMVSEQEMGIKQEAEEVYADAEDKGFAAADEVDLQTIVKTEDDASAVIDKWADETIQPIIEGPTDSEREMIKDESLATTTDIPAESAMSVYKGPEADKYTAPSRNELLSWLDSLNGVREVIAKCPNCRSIKKDADRLAEKMAAFAGTDVKDVSAADEIAVKVEPEEPTLTKEDAEIEDEQPTPVEIATKEEEIIERPGVGEPEEPAADTIEAKIEVAESPLEIPEEMKIQDSEVEIIEEHPAERPVTPVLVDLEEEEHSVVEEAARELDRIHATLSKIDDQELKEIPEDIQPEEAKELLVEEMLDAELVPIEDEEIVAEETPEVGKEEIKDEDVPIEEEEEEEEEREEEAEKEVEVEVAIREELAEVPGPEDVDEKEEPSEMEQIQATEKIEDVGQGIEKEEIDMTEVEIEKHYAMELVEDEEIEETPEELITVEEEMEEIPVGTILEEEAEGEEEPIDEVPVEVTDIEEGPEEIIPVDEEGVEDIPVEVAKLEEIPEEMIPIDEEGVEEIPVELAEGEEISEEMIPVDEEGVEEIPVELAEAEEISEEMIPVDEEGVEDIPVELAELEEIPGEMIVIDEEEVEEIPVELAEVEQISEEMIPIDEEGVEEIPVELVEFEEISEDLIPVDEEGVEEISVEVVEEEEIPEETISPEEKEEEVADVVEEMEPVAEKPEELEEVPVELIDPDLVIGSYLTIAEIEEEEKVAPCVCKSAVCPAQPPPRPEVTSTIEITETEVFESVSIQVVMQTLSNATTQTFPPERIVRRTREPTLESVTQTSLRPDADLFDQLPMIRKLLRDRSTVPTASASTQTDKSQLRRSREDQSRYGSLPISDVMRPEGSRLTGPEQELRSITYSQRSEMDKGVCNCCVCGKPPPSRASLKTVAKDRTTQLKLISSMFRQFVPPKIDEKTGPDRLCPECKVKRIEQGKSLGQGSTKKAIKKITCDQELCVCPSGGRPHPSSRRKIKEKKDQACMAKISRLKVDAVRIKRKLEVRKTVQETPVPERDTDSLVDCICYEEIPGESGLERKLNCTCGDSD